MRQCFLRPGQQKDQGPVVMKVRTAVKQSRIRKRQQRLPVGIPEFPAITHRTRKLYDSDPHPGTGSGPQPAPAQLAFQLIHIPRGGKQGKQNFFFQEIQAFRIVFLQIPLCPDLPDPLYSFLHGTDKLLRHHRLLHILNGSQFNSRLEIFFIGIAADKQDLAVR